MTRETDERMLTLTTNLLEATNQGKISWALTDEEQKFLYAGSRSSVTIEFYKDREGDDIYILSLMNSRGTAVDSLQSEWTYEGNGYTAASWNELLKDLYHAARRIAHNVDEAIEGMLIDIERGTPSPGPKPKSKPIAIDPWAESSASEEPPF